MDNNYAKNVQNNIDKFLKKFLFNLLTFIYFIACGDYKIIDFAFSLFESFSLRGKNI